MERESVQRERDCTGRREFESETRGSQTRGSRCINATNAGFETRVQVRTRGERGRGRELRVAFNTRRTQTRVLAPRCEDTTNVEFDTRVQVRTRGERRREHELRVALIQERVDRVKELPRRRGEIRV